MRMSDWSSDVCSSDLGDGGHGGRGVGTAADPLDLQPLLLVVTLVVGDPESAPFDVLDPAEGDADLRPLLAVAARARVGRSGASGEGERGGADDAEAGGAAAAGGGHGGSVEGRGGQE